jgi:hypothetical protein
MLQKRRELQERLDKKLHGEGPKLLRLRPSIYLVKKHL